MKLVVHSFASTRRRWLVAATALAAVRAAMPAPALGADVLRLDEVLAAARAQNPAITAARERARAAAAVPRQVSAYDDPVLAYEAYNIPESLRLDQSENNIVRVSQKLPFPGKRRLAGAVAGHEAEMADHEAAGSELDVLAEVKRAYYALWQAHQNVVVYGRERALFERIGGIATQRYALGEGSQGDVLRTQIDLTRLVNRVNTETLAIDAARAELNGLLSRAPDEPLGVPEEPGPFVLDGSARELAEQALAERPELRVQAAAIAREEAALALAHRSSLPDFEVTAGRFFNNDAADGFGAIVSVTIPWAYKSKYDAGVTAASARLASARAELRRLQDRVRTDVTAAFTRVRAALLEHDLLVTTHVPQTEQALRVGESAYQAGAMDFPSLMETVRVVEDVHLEHVAAAAAFERAYADLERAVGRELPRTGGAARSTGGSDE